MPEVKHVGIAVSQANDCRNCTGAFCTVLSHGPGLDAEYVESFLGVGPTRSTTSACERASGTLPVDADPVR